MERQKKARGITKYIPESSLLSLRAGSLAREATGGALLHLVGLREDILGKTKDVAEVHNAYTKRKLDEK